MLLVRVSVSGYTSIPIFLPLIFFAVQKIKMSRCCVALHDIKTNTETLVTLDEGPSSEKNVAIPYVKQPSMALHGPPNQFQFWYGRYVFYSAGLCRRCECEIANLLSLHEHTASVHAVHAAWHTNYEM